MTTRNRKLNEKMAALLGDDVGSVNVNTELDAEEDNSSAELVATQKLIQNHREEYDFYFEHAKTHGVEKWEDLPNPPISLKAFSLADYLKVALACAEYEQDEDGLIVARVPGAVGCYSQGESYEEARTNLLDAIEGNVLIALQMGWEIPQVQGFEIRTEVVPAGPA